jgi:glycosyltransferase involved in cell wall biosynthesis
VTRRAVEPVVALVGPTHPHRGGIAQHATRLAHEIAGRGLSTVIESWRAQYPRALRRGLGELPADRPELAPFPHVRSLLAWYAPWSWFRAGRRLRRARLVLVTVVTPFQAIPYLVLRAAAGRGPRIGAIVHNVLPHSRSSLDRALMRALLRRSGVVIVHGERQRDLAVDLGVPPERLRAVTLPAPGVGGTPARAPLPRLAGAERLTLLFFGMVRPYKGLEVLLHALRDAPTARLVVAGHFWEPVERYRRLIRELGLADRVELAPGYVDAADIPSLFARADAIVMPYRSATASIVPTLAFAHGRPVVATDVGTLADTVADGVTGLVVPPEQPRALAAAIERIAEVPTLGILAAAVAASEFAAEEAWSRYVGVIEAEIRRDPTG